IQERLCRFGVQAVGDVRRTTWDVAGDRDSDEHELAIHGQEVRTAGVPVTGAAVAGRRVLRQPQIPLVERHKALEREAAWQGIDVDEEWRPAADDSVLHTVAGHRERPPVESVLVRELIEETSGRERRGRDARRDVRQDQKSEITGVALALAVVRVGYRVRHGNEGGDRRPGPPGAGGEHVSEAHVQRVAERSELGFEEHNAMRRREDDGWLDECRRAEWREATVWRSRDDRSYVAIRIGDIGRPKDDQARPVRWRTWPSPLVGGTAHEEGKDAGQCQRKTSSRHNGNLRLNF